MLEELMKLVRPRPVARVSGACFSPLSLDPYATARTAHDHTLRVVLDEATARQRDESLSPEVRAWYRRASSIYWLESVRRGISHAGEGFEVIYN